MKPITGPLFVVSFVSNDNKFLSDFTLTNCVVSQPFKSKTIKKR
jgi:hypothetical protein